MIFRNVLEKALGSPIKIKILRYLLVEGVPTSERELARILGISHTAVNRAMKDFEDLNLVTQMRIGGAIVWRLKTDSYLCGHHPNSITITPINALKQFKEPLDKLKEKIKETLDTCKSQGVDIKEAFIFGSVAEGTETSNSDIDLFVVTSRKETVLKYISALQDEFYTCFGNRLSPHILNQEEYLKPSKQQKTLIEQAEKGIKVL